LVGFGSRASRTALIVLAGLLALCSYRWTEVREREVADVVLALLLARPLCNTASTKKKKKKKKKKLTT
jgi:hypothetical protein